jgi:hypothetical protein
MENNFQENIKNNIDSKIEENKLINNNTENKQPTLKKHTRKSIKKVCWDEEKLAEQELDKKLNPKMKIDDPKTPFNHIQDDETEKYLIMLKETQNFKPEVFFLDTIVYLNLLIIYLIKNSKIIRKIQY